jgi:hypothetical protein
MYCNRRALYCMHCMQTWHCHRQKALMPQYQPGMPLYVYHVPAGHCTARHCPACTGRSAHTALVPVRRGPGAPGRKLQRSCSAAEGGIPGVYVGSGGGGVGGGKRGSTTASIVASKVEEGRDMSSTFHPHCQHMFGMPPAAIIYVGSSTSS